MWVAVLAGLLVGLKFYDDHENLKRLQVVRPGVFYRLGQPSESGLRELIGKHGVRTVVSTQLFDIRLKKGMFDFGLPDGEKESTFVRSLGARPIQWPMGEEACWPWPTPWQFEAFFDLIDDPSNQPVAVHCAGGRHRTGTWSALFRLEYDRWPVDQVLAEMYSFKFGEPDPVHEHNLRTYLPRPRPDEPGLVSLLSGLRPAIRGSGTLDFEMLIRELRPFPPDERALEAERRYLEEGRPFACCLAQRLIRSADDPLIPAAVTSALEAIRSDSSPEGEWAMAAAFLSDYGSPAAQEELLEILRREPLDQPPTPLYRAIVRGVTNRYTRNRIAWLVPLLNDERNRPESESAHYRYCETAAARLSSIVNERLGCKDGRIWDWQTAVEQSREWIEAHPEVRAPDRLMPPWGQNAVHPGDGGPMEDARPIGH